MNETIFTNIVVALCRQTPDDKQLGELVREIYYKYDKQYDKCV